MKPLLRCEAITVARGDRIVVRAMSLEAREGELVGVLGPSGAGKSTFFRAIVGDLPMASGRVWLGARDLTRAPLFEHVRAGMGYVSQQASVLWDLDVTQNLVAYFRAQKRGLGALWRGKPTEDERREALALADKVSLTDRLDVRAGDLSGGERRRLELARALTCSPKVLVCDEPFAGVDPKQATLLGDLLMQLATKGVCVLLADHHVEEALRICTRAVLLLDGAVAVDALPDVFRQDPLVQGRYLGSWQRSLIPPEPRSTEPQGERFS